MEKIIYIQLLGEGTLVYRPVLSVKVDEDVYQVGGKDIYDPDDEEWEFLPESIVKVEERELEDGKVLVAVEKKEG